MDNYWRNREVVRKGGGSPQARFYRGDYDWMFEREVEGEEEGDGDGEEY